MAAAKSRRLTTSTDTGKNVFRGSLLGSTAADQVMMARQMQHAADEEARLEYFPPHKIASMMELKKALRFTLGDVERKRAENPSIGIDDEGLSRPERIVLMRKAFKERWPKTFPKT